MWGALLEKAWAKTFSNYKALGKGGYSSQSLKALNGAPTKVYALRRYRSWSMYVSVNNAKVYGYLHNVETTSSPDNSGDTKTNSCGITYQHAYSLLDTF